MLKRKAAKYLNAPVLKKLASGTKPRITQDGSRVMIPRREIAEDVVNMCLPQSNNDSSKFLRFGVVIGPSGSGKTTAITEMCNRHPKGVLYYEIGEPKNFVNGLSKSIGLKTSPTTVLDLALGCISQSYKFYYSLPPDQIAGLDMILEVLANAATLYSRKFGEIPVLCIDGVDLLAKREEMLCEALITLAKVLANSNKLKLVLISSEGGIMPFLGLACMK